MNVTMVFPGQGAQILGMGKEFAKNFATSREVFEEVDDALGQKLSAIVWGDCQDTLNLTANAQPALMATSMAILRAAESEGLNWSKISLLAGHSLGEYTAYCAAQSLSLADTAKLLRIRGKAMQAAVPVGEGAMAAILGLDINAVESIVATANGGVCEVANDNDPKQVVISGHATEIDKAIEIATNKGARRSVLLNTSAPFHCSLMQPAAERMKEALSEVAINSPRIPIIANITASKVEQVSEAVELLVKQVTGRVRWRESVVTIKEKGVETTVEVGAGQTLSGMIRRTESSISTSSCSKPEHIQALLEIMDR